MVVPGGGAVSYERGAPVREGFVGERWQRLGGSLGPQPACSCQESPRPSILAQESPKPSLLAQSDFRMLTEDATQAQAQRFTVMIDAYYEYSL